MTSRKTRCTALAALLPLGLVCPAAAGQGEHRYLARLSDDFSTLQVQACFASPAPAQLLADHDQAHRYLRLPQSIDSNSGRLRLDGETLRVVNHEPGQCLSYEVDLSAAASQGRRAPVSRIGADLRTDPRLWLWRSADGEEIELGFSLPVGVSVSAPWREIAANRYLIGTALSGWRSAVAFGQLERFAIVVPGATLKVALLDGSPAANPAEVRRWLTDAAATVAGAYGRFPVPNAQILVVPVDAGGWGSDQAVPFGHVLRGGGPAIEFFVNTRRPIEEYLSDWTAAHELSHLLHPLLSQQDVWLSEGLASYYQNVLRARAGVLQQRIAWQKLHEGFERGIAGTNGVPLNRVAANMHRDRAYMRVYWSGAAVALMADAGLRIESDNQASLDEALARFSHCCLPAERRWSGREFMAKLGELMDTELFSDLYDRYSLSPRFPDVESLYQQLGLTADETGRISLRPAAHADVRERIMRGAYSHSSSL